MILTLTVRQRLNLETIIRNKRGPDDDDARTVSELFKKIRIDKEERKQYVKEIPGMMPIVDEKTIDKASTITVELDKAEARKLRTLLKEWTNYSVEDFEWKDDLDVQLSNPAEK